MDNTTWSEPRYGFVPGQEHAYIMMETPEGIEPGGIEKDLVILDRLSVVLDPKNVRVWCKKRVDSMSGARSRRKP